ncbi:head portal vertex protein [Caulobacter phage Cr30]|uniref:portal protein n=1 Tax=Caulobacter phage Cr30 TaxID=1357714 RepID=UPI0004A9B4DC|nr:portal protein [Caulobacter phage Cr30]AGS81070.1 head portal vertex protein [Caulobacter phage Cr30]
MELFGFSISKKGSEEVKDLRALAPPEHDDGALVVAPGGSFGVFLDLEGSAKTDADLISKYRTMYNQPECKRAVDKIINEAIVKQDDKPVCTINLDRLKVSDKVKDAIRKEFIKVTELLNINNEGYNIFLRWYVDGRINYQTIIDFNNPREGIQETRYLDPRKLRKVRTTKAKKNGRVVTLSDDREFYLYNDKGFDSKKVSSSSGVPGQMSGIKIDADNIVQVTSGLVNENNTMVLGYLHQAIRPLNMLRQLEDAMIINRVSRAAERRIWYVDVGNLPKAKAEEYLKQMMVKHKNKVIYDPGTGAVSDARKYQTLYEDIWMPTRGGDRGTRIDTLPGLSGGTALDDVNYMKEKLYDSLNVPRSRLDDSSNTFNLGHSSEISRDELEFQKFIDRLRTRFSQIFDQILSKQLILKGIITDEDWLEFQNKIDYDFARDNYYAELKDAEILQERLTLVSEVDNLQGKYFSKEWIWRNVLKMDDQAIAKMKAEMESEKEDDRDSDGAEPPMYPGQDQPSDDGSQGDFDTPTYQDYVSGDSPNPYPQANVIQVPQQ